MRVQTVVQHHPSRAHLLPGLLAALPAVAQVVEDPGAGDPRRNPWRCYLACLRSLEPDASHLLVVQDDCEPCLDFGKVVVRVARRHRNVPVALFCPGVGQQSRAILAACGNGQRYAELPVRGTFIPCVAVLWPRECVEAILQFEEAQPFPPAFTADDGNLGKVAQACGWSVLATVPSLVEHPDRERSLVGKQHLAGRNPARVAACWTGPDWSPAGLDW